MRIASARTLFGITLAVLLFAGEAAAQTTTGGIRGRVSDPSKAAVTSAGVIARNTATGLERSALTDAQGVFTIRPLPPGIYSVRTSMLGFAAQTLPNITVALGQMSTANFQLTVQAVDIGQITSTVGRPPINTTNASVIQGVSQQEIDKLPVLGRNFTDFISLSGVVTPDPGVTTGGQFSIAGQRSSQTNIQIDGVDTNNSFFGENRGGSRIPFVFSLESIQEFQVVTNGYDVEYGSYSGGVVNVLTRGGTNTRKGSAYLNYRGDALTSKGFRDTIKVNDYEVSQFAGSLAGPIKKDKAFYLFSVDGQRRREPQIPVQLSDYAAGGARANANVEQEVKSFFAILDSVYGQTNSAAGYLPFQTKNDAVSAFGRVDWNFNDMHRLSVRHNYSNYNNDNEWDDTFDFTYGSSRAEKLQSHSNSFVTELTSVLNAKTFNVFRFQWSNEDRPRNGKNIRPALVLRLTNGQYIGFGGTFVGFNNNLEERKFQFIDNFSRVINNHTLKLGANTLFTRNHNTFLGAVSGRCGGSGSQGAGLYCFGDVASFAAGIPQSYQFNVLQNADGLVPDATFNVAELGIYLQDEWHATSQLTVTAGVRHDRQKFGDAPGRLVDVERAFGFPTATAPVDNNNISPRLSLAYDLGGNGRGVIRAGAGYFYGRVPYVLGGNVLSSQNPVYNLTCTGNITKKEATAPPSPLDYPNWATDGSDNPTNCLGTGGFSGVPSYTVWSPEFEFPETFKANAGFERLFAGDRLKISTDLIYSKSTNLYTVRNLNLRESQFQLVNEGNRRVFTPAALFNPAVANTESSKIYDTFGPVFVNYTDGRAEAFVGTIEANYKLTDKTSLRASYTRTNAHDNSSYSCCTASSGFSSAEVGAFGPNDVGGFGDSDKAWGPSNFSRDHTGVLSGFTQLPFGINVSAIWRIQSGRHFTPEVSGDINGDGVRFNDRPFIFASADLPIAASTSAAAAATIRAAYDTVLMKNKCLSEAVGTIV
ncbi:MAG: TonB-dependent receptor, partial [Longimicrobiales bacterium]